jgi:hypothetical protein
MRIRDLEVPAGVLSQSALTGDQEVKLRALVSRVSAPFPALYPLGMLIKLVTEFQFLLGNRSDDFPPGDVDPSLCLVIGDTEPDSPIALDYRTVPPRVVYLCDVENVSYWVELAPSYEEFRKAIDP